jgi:signal peptidase II
LIYIHNTGAAFGIFQNQNIFFSVVAVIVIVAIVIYVRRTPEIDPVIAASLGLQLGGAAGNLVDRLRFGYVVDFIYVQHFAISNISDACITLGVILLGYQLLRYGQPATSQVATLKDANTAPPATPTDNPLELHQR